VLLLDDVVTTASTLREAARQLAASGDCSVTVSAIARAVR
jgi:predicted amidophosphoribosyltransferase